MRLGPSQSPANTGARRAVAAEVPPRRNDESAGHEPMAGGNRCV